MDLPAHINPQTATDPLSAWQYTDGDTNGTDMPAGVPGIGHCDMSAVSRPQDFGFGEDMPITKEEVDRIAAASAAAIAHREIRPGLTAAQAWRDANGTRAMLAELPATIADELPTGSGLTKEQVEAAATRAIRAVLRELDEPPA